MIVIETKFRYIIFTIYALRGTGSIVQFSEIKFLDSSGNVFPWPSGTVVTSSIDATSDRENAAKVIDGSVDTKFCSTKYASGAYIDIDLGPGNYIDLSVYTQWQWYTANDSPERDPVDFIISVSNDVASSIVVDGVKGATITENRKSLAYTGEFHVASENTNKVFAKIDGSWVQASNVIGNVNGALV